jgi:endonuclease III
MSDSKRAKLKTFLQLLEKRFGRLKPPAFLPPPSSADVEAAVEVATRNSQLVAAAILGLHGPPEEGLEAARRLMAQFVDWNEVRVAMPESFLRVLEHDRRAASRAALFQRFLEAFFLRQRNMNLEFVVGLKPPERKQFLANLEVLSREELPAVLLTGFLQPVFPPSEDLHRVALRCGLLKGKTTLQMPKEFETLLDPEELYSLYAYLYHVAEKHCHVENPACPHCALKPKCPAARAFIAASHAAAKHH